MDVARVGTGGAVLLQTEDHLPVTPAAGRQLEEAVLQEQEAAGQEAAAETAVAKVRHQKAGAIQAADVAAKKPVLLQAGEIQI